MVVVCTLLKMEKQEVPVKSNVRVVMHEMAREIEEVVVTGYGNVGKNTYTGSVDAVDASTIEKKSPTEATKALAGEVAGLQMINSSGQPGTNATLVLRGVGSLSGRTTPLYVVDGMTYDGDISSIDPGDIASISVLKDATATSIYGARGANGVVVITTKKGSSGDEGKIDIDVKYGANTRLLPLYDVITSPEEYVLMSWMSIYGGQRVRNKDVSSAITAANTSLFSPTGIPAGYNMWDMAGRYLIEDNRKGDFVYPTFASDVNRKAGYENLESWRDEIFRVGQKLDASVKLHGGSEKVNYYTSIGYLKDEGYYQSSDYDRFNIRTNLDFEPKKWLKANVNVHYAYTHLNNPDQAGDGVMNNGFYYVNAIPPVYPVFRRDADGSISVDPRTGMKTYDYGDELMRNFGMGINPAGSLRLDKENQVQHEVDAKGTLELKFGEMHKSLQGLKFTLNAGAHYFNNLYTELTNKYYGDAAGIGRIGQQSYNLFAITSQQLLEYNKTFDDHTIRVMVGHESYLYQAKYLAAQKSYLASGTSLELGNAVKVNDASGNSSRFSLDSYLATATYSYAERYTISANYRADGSSRYAAGHRWGHFGSVGFAWTFTNENFMNDQEWIKNGKLRLSWGVLGNQISSLYSYTNMYAIDNVNDEPVYLEGSKGNQDITWERSNTTDLGLEFSLKNYLDVEFDYFYKLTDNMLFSRATPPSLGYSSVPTNDAKMVNQGVEFALKAHAVNERNVKLDLRLTGAHYKNYMTQMPIDYEKADGTIVRQKMNGAMAEGHSMYDHYTVKYLGVDNTGSALYEGWYDATKGSFADPLENGEYNYIRSLHQWWLENKDNYPGKSLDNLIDEGILASESTNDYTLAASQYLYKNGKHSGSVLSYLPDLDGGFGFDLDVYGVTLSASCSYRIGGYGYDYTYMALMDDGQVGGHNWHVDMRNAWTEETADAVAALPINKQIPRLTNALGEFAQYSNAGSTRFLTSNSYISLNDIQIGYNFQKKLIEKIKLQKLHIYFSASNLAIATARRGYNPMTSFTGSSDTHGYSPLSTFMGGIKLTF